jgi:isocitrate dehydrogenase
MEGIGEWLKKNKVPGRKVHQLDNRGSSYYVALYWAKAMAKKDG